MYTYLSGEKKDCGSPNCLATISSSTGSILSWFGGAMPPNGPQSNAQATTDIEAWVAAGAQNN